MSSGSSGANKVYIVTYHSFPIGWAPTSRIICYAKGLHANGVSCEVVTMAFSEESGGCFEGVPYTCISKRTKGQKVNKLFRIYYRFRDLVAGLRYCNKTIRPNDVVILYSQNVVFYCAYLIWAKIRKIRIYNELGEIPYNNQSLLNRCRRYLMVRFIFPFFTGFLVISKELEQLIRKYSGKKTDLIKIPIMVDISRFESQEYVDIPEKYKTCPYIFYAGAISEQKDGVVSSIKAFIEALPYIDFPVRYILAGQVTADWETIEELARKHNLEDVVVCVGNLLPQQVAGYLKYASLFISNKNDNLQNRNGFSTKTGEVLASGVPMITTKVGELMFYLQDSVSAYIVAPERPDLISKKIIQAFNNPEERLRIAAEGKRVALQQFNYVHQGQRLAEFLFRRQKV